MRCPGILPFIVVIACMFVAGCTQVSGTGPAATVVPAASLPPADPVAAVTAAAETAVPAQVPTSEPQQVVTILHQVSLVKDVKDSELLFSLQVPVEWSVSTRRIENPENFVGFMYQTDLKKNNTFYIHTFTNYRNREQNYRDDCLRSVPPPDKTVVTINGLVFDRFESAADGRTNVTYVMRQAGMNERGYLSVLSFSADDSNRFEKEDYDKVVASFRYYGKDKVSAMPGEEIVRIIPLPGEAGNMRSASGGSSSGVQSSRSSGGGCPR